MDLISQHSSLCICAYQIRRRKRKHPVSSLNLLVRLISHYIGFSLVTNQRTLFFNINIIICLYKLHQFANKAKDQGSYYYYKLLHLAYYFAVVISSWFLLGSELPLPKPGS